MGKDLVNHVVDNKKAADAAVRKLSRQSQANLNARLDNQRFLNVSGSTYDSMTSKDSTTIYLVSRGDYIELYKGDIPISGQGGGLVVENALYATAIPNTTSTPLPTQFGGMFTAGTRITDSQIPSNHQLWVNDTTNCGVFVIDDYSCGIYMPDSMNYIYLRGQGAFGESTLVLPIERADSTITSLYFTLKTETVTTDFGNRYAGSITKSVKASLWNNSVKLRDIYSDIRVDEPVSGTNGYQYALVPIVSDNEGHLKGIAVIQSYEYISGNRFSISSTVSATFLDSSSAPMGILYDANGDALPVPKLYGLSNNEKEVLKICVGEAQT